MHCVCTGYLTEWPANEERLDVARFAPVLVETVLPFLGKVGVPGDRRALVFLRSPYVGVGLVLVRAVEKTRHWSNVCADRLP